MRACGMDQSGSKQGNVECFLKMLLNIRLP